MSSENAGKAARKEIAEVYERLKAALEKEDFSDLKNILLPEAKAFFSNIGSFCGAKEIMEGLKWKGEEVNIRRFETVNFVALSAGDRAQQSCCLLGLLAYDDGKQFFPFQFGGRFANSLVHTDDGWKFSELRFDLDWDHGNTAFARHWKLVDYSIGWHPKMQMKAILCELDAPWRVIKNPDYLGTDEEQIAYAFYKIAWGEDTMDFELMAEVYSEDFTIDFPPNGELTKRQILSILKQHRFGEANWEHVGKIANITINGDNADMIIFRLEPHRIAPFVLTRKNYESPIYSARYEIKLRKEEGGWHMTRMDYFPGAFMYKE